MTVDGHIENGQIVLDESIPLVEGMRVRVELVPSSTAVESGSTAESAPTTFYERHKSWIGSVTDAPSDYARNHDHYLHGQPKE